MYPFFFDPTMIIIIPALLIAVYAQYKVKSTFNQYSEIYSDSGLTGAEAARKIMQNKNITGVNIKKTSGNLTDHYDPKNRVLNLSQDVYSSSSIAAIGVAAHEAGHALQDAESYKPLAMRASLVPAANLGSSLGLPMAIFGFLSEQIF